jgi:hypothetical protein
MRDRSCPRRQFGISTIEIHPRQRQVEVRLAFRFIVRLKNALRLFTRVLIGGEGRNRSESLPRHLLRNSLNATRNPIESSITRAFSAFKDYLPELRHYSLTIILLFLSIGLLEILLEVENQIFDANCPFRFTAERVPPRKAG